MMHLTKEKTQWVYEPIPGEDPLITFQLKLDAEDAVPVVEVVSRDGSKLGCGLIVVVAMRWQNAINHLDMTRWISASHANTRCTWCYLVRVRQEEDFALNSNSLPSNVKAHHNLKIMLWMT